MEQSILFFEMNEYNKTIKFKFLKPADPNTSIGKLISFKKDGQLVAHLSFAWESRLWFGYSNDGRFEDVHFSSLFNDYQNKDFKNFQISLNGMNLILIQENFCYETKLKCSIEFDSVEYFEDFFEYEVEKINNNDYFLSEFIILQKEEIIETDIILTIYKSFDHIENCLESIFKTTDNNILKINKIIFCDNNTNVGDVQKCINLFKKYKNKYQSVEWIYFKNKDETYVHSRITGLNQSLSLCSSDVVSVFDTDIIFLSSEWCNTYQFYNQFDNATGCGVLPDQTNSNYYRDSYIILRRFHPFFFHAKREYLQSKVNEDENYFGDFKLKTQYKNLELNYMGLHFAKVYAEAKSDLNCLFKILPDENFISLIKINNLSYNKYKNLFVLHLEGMSFEETWKNDKYLKQKYEILYSNCKNLVDSNSEFLQPLSKLMWISLKKSESFDPVFSEKLFIPKNYNGNILVVAQKDFNLSKQNDEFVSNSERLKFENEENLVEIYIFEKFIFVKINDDILALEKEMSKTDRFLVSKNVRRI